MPRLGIALLPLALLAASCANRPRHRQPYAFGIAPFIGLRGPHEPGGLDLDIAPPAVYLGLFRIVSVNLSPSLFEFYVFPISLGFEIGASHEAEPEAAPPVPARKRKEPAPEEEPKKRV